MAHILPHRVLQAIKKLNSSQEERPSAPGEENENDYLEGQYQPSPLDIIVVRVMLTRAVKLPIEVVDNIFDQAEYWAHSSNEIDYLVEHQSPLKVHASSNMENKFLIRSFPVGLTGFKGKKDLAEELAYDTNEAQPLPLSREHDSTFFMDLADHYPTPQLANPVRKVVFSIRSRDQGWGGDRGSRGTYEASWTWFDVGLERFDADAICDAQCTYDVRYKSKNSVASPLPVCGLRAIQPILLPVEGSEHEYRFNHPILKQPKWEIQRNKTATREWQDHVITWSYLDNIKPHTEEASKLDLEHGRGRGTLDGSFVRSLKMGDVITIWGKARFSGWTNHIEKVKIDVYWAL